MKPGAAYYRGGARVVIDGVPLRLARKPSAHDLAWMRDDRAKRIAREANAAIANYARALGITDKEARKRIDAQREYVAATPVIDQSLEYDL